MKTGRFIVTGITAIASFAQTATLQPLKTAAFPGEIFRDPAASAAFWDKGFLVVPKFATSATELPSADIYNQKAGKIATVAGGAIPNVSSVHFYGLSVRSGAGDSVVSGTFRNENGDLSAALWFFDQSGNFQRTVLTDPFVPRHLTVASDGSIWGFGEQLRQSAADKAVDSETVERFDSDGALFGRYLKKSTFGNVGDPTDQGGAKLGRTLMFAAADHVGIYSAPARQWIEFSREGLLLGRWTIQPPEQLQPEVNYLAFTRDYRLLSWFWPRELGHNPQICELDRTASRWVPTGAPVGEYAWIDGADGTGLILGRKNYGLAARILEWVHPPPAPIFHDSGSR